jgi:hypothetical protein
VQTSPSPHSLSALQQPEIGVLEQVLPPHESVVQGLASLQSAFVVQPQPEPWGGRTAASKSGQFPDPTWTPRDPDEG